MGTIIGWVFIILLFLGFIGWLITFGVIGKIIAGIIVGAIVVLVLFKLFER